MNRVQVGAGLHVFAAARHRCACPRRPKEPFPGVRWSAVAQLEVAVEESRSLAEGFRASPRYWFSPCGLIWPWGGGRGRRVGAVLRWQATRAASLASTGPGVMKNSPRQNHGPSLRRLEQEDLQCLWLLVANWRDGLRTPDIRRPYLRWLVFGRAPRNRHGPGFIDWRTTGHWG